MDWKWGSCWLWFRCRRVPLFYRRTDSIARIYSS